MALWLFLGFLILCAFLWKLEDRDIFLFCIYLLLVLRGRFCEHSWSWTTINRELKSQSYVNLMGEGVSKFARNTIILTEADEERIQKMEKKNLEDDLEYRNWGIMWKLESKNKLWIRKLTNGKSIVRFIKVQRLKCLGQIVKIDDNIMVKSISYRKLLGKKSKGKPKKIMRITNSMKNIKNRGVRNKLGEKAQTYTGSNCFYSFIYH